MSTNTQLVYCGSCGEVYNFDCGHKCKSSGKYGHQDLLAELVKARAERDALREAVRWIPVGERLPEDEADTLEETGYLVQTISKNKFVAAFWNGYFISDGGMFENSEVTHWMSLPRDAQP